MRILKYFLTDQPTPAPSFIVEDVPLNCEVLSVQWQDPSAALNPHQSRGFFAWILVDEAQERKGDLEFACLWTGQKSPIDHGQFQHVSTVQSPMGLVCHWFVRTQ